MQISLNSLMRPLLSRFNYDKYDKSEFDGSVVIQHFAQITSMNEGYGSSLYRPNDVIFNY
jgi:hypothetical protein